MKADYFSMECGACSAILASMAPISAPRHSACGHCSKLGNATPVETPGEKLTLALSKCGRF